MCIRTVALGSVFCKREAWVQISQAFGGMMRTEARKVLKPPLKNRIYRSAPIAFVENARIPQRPAPASAMCTL